MTAQFECCGGPLDGAAVGDRGFMFVLMGSAEAVQGDVVVRPAHGSGTYVRSARGYDWEPDA